MQFWKKMKMKKSKKKQRVKGRREEIEGSSSGHLSKTYTIHSRLPHYLVFHAMPAEGACVS